MTWSADSIDCILFMQPVAGTAPDALQPWLKVFSTPPRSYQGPIAGSGPSPVAQAFGPVGSYTATITAQLGRLELRLSAEARSASQLGSPVPIGGPPPVISNVASALEALVAYAEQLLLGCNPARMGLILNLSRLETSAANGLASFQSALPIFGKIPELANEVSFALNLPHAVTLSNSTNPMANRLCRWGMARRQIMMVTLNVGSGSPAPILTMNESFVSTLQIDINSVPEATTEQLTTWTPQLAYEMLQKMKLIALPILENGYEGFLVP